MTRRLLALSTVFMLATFAAIPVEGAIETSEDLRRVAEAFFELEIDPARAHDVADAAIIRDIATIRLNKGVIVFSEELEGITPYAFFVGEGSFTITPIRKMDRKMLDLAAEEHLGKAPGGMMNTEISEAVLVAIDRTWDVLRPALSDPRQATEEEMEAARRLLKEQQEMDRKIPDFSMDDVAGAPELDLISAALSHPQSLAAFRAEVNTADYGWLSFGWSPSSTYEVRLGTREPIGAFLDYHPLVVTHRKEDLDQSGRFVADPNADLHEIMNVKRYRMDLEVPDLQQIDIDVDVTFTPTVEGLRTPAFVLINDLKGPHWDSRQKYVDILSLTDAEGNELPFIHRKHVVIILLPEALEKDKETTLTFRLNEQTITQLSNVHYSLLNTYPWYPWYGHLGGQYEFDWTIKTVKPLTATGSGVVVKTWEEGNLNAVQMIFDRPVTFPSIIFGRYQAEEGEMDSVAAASTIPLSAHSWPKTIFTITDPQICSQPGVRCPFNIELNVPPRKPDDVIEEAETIIKFMEDLYGPYPYENLDVAMMAPGMGFGQAPPAFVQLTGEAFMSSAALANFKYTNPDFFHGFFSHEIAHQWWGHKISWIANEDVWLSEAFAEYSAGLFVLSYLGKERYLDKLRDWKENAKIGDPHGSIAWSGNLSGPNGFKWRTGLLYNKGPYVVHMLRMQMGIDNFKKAMKAVFEEYGYTRITTTELQRECEKVVGYSLDFFFDQWFRDTGIPVFEYSWDAEQEEDGKYLVTVKIAQRDKENFKKVLMPVYFYFKSQDDPMIRPRPILTAEDTYMLKLPEKPTRIVLDVDDDILGDMIPLGRGAGM